MTQSSAITIPDASTLAVDTSCIDVSEVEIQEDKDFLMEKGENILRIVARAALEVGQQLVEIQEYFKEEKLVGLKAFYQSIGVTPVQASSWSSKYRAFCAYIDLFGPDGAPEKFEALGNRTAEKLWALPEDYREAFLFEIEAGNTPKQTEVEEVARDPEVKLTKAQELLKKAKIRKTQATDKKAEWNADEAIQNFEQQIADLKAQIEEEKLKTAEETASKALVEKELQKLKFDDAKVRAERVKKLSTTLTVSLPQALADVSKFFAEIDSYPEETRQHIYNSAKSLANEIADKL